MEALNEGDGPPGAARTWLACRAAYRGTPVEAQRLDLPIGGMHCAGCVARVEKVLQDLPGVQEAQVNLATETATLHYEPATLTLAQVVQAVQASGYQVRLEHTTIPVKGMHCAGCVATIERALRSVPGVVEAQVNLATEQATVAYVPTSVETSTLRQAITRAGYEPLTASRRSSAPPAKC